MATIVHPKPLHSTQLLPRARRIGQIHPDTTGSARRSKLPTRASSNGMEPLLMRVRPLERHASEAEEGLVRGRAVSVRVGSQGGGDSQMVRLASATRHTSADSGQNRGLDQQQASTTSTAADTLLSPPHSPASAPPSALLLLAVSAGAAAALFGVWRTIAAASGQRSVDSLARRGLIPSDSNEPMRVIGEFDTPTAIRNYRLGSAQLVELEPPLAPLTEEKMRYHRQLRQKEHGWLKPQVILVEGDPVPEGVDLRTVRFIPAKHPFALASSDSQASELPSEEVARRRLKQRSGRPEKVQERSRQHLLHLQVQQERERERESRGE